VTGDPGMRKIAPGMTPIATLALAAIPALVFGIGAPMCIEAMPPRGSESERIVLPEMEAPGSAHWCEDLRAVLTLRRNTVGDIEMFLRGRPIHPDDLTTKLLLYAERKRDLEHPDQPSEVFLHLRAEPGIPWGEVRRVLLACQDPDVRMYKIAFAVRRAPR